MSDYTVSNSAGAFPTCQKCGGKMEKQSWDPIEGITWRCAQCGAVRTQSPMQSPNVVQLTILNANQSAKIADLCAANARLQAELAHMTEAYDTQARVHDRLNKDYIAVRDELAGLRADIEAGRLVRIPALGQRVYQLWDGKLYSGCIQEIKLVPQRTIVFFGDNTIFPWMGDWMKDTFPTEQAARAAADKQSLTTERAAKEDGNENPAL